MDVSDRDTANLRARVRDLVETLEGHEEPPTSGHDVVPSSPAVVAPAPAAPANPANPANPVRPAPKRRARAAKAKASSARAKAPPRPLGPRSLDDVVPSGRVLAVLRPWLMEPSNRRFMERMDIMDPTRHDYEEFWNSIREVIDEFEESFPPGNPRLDHHRKEWVWFLWIFCLCNMFWFYQC